MHYPCLPQSPRGSIDVDQARAIAEVMVILTLPSKKPGGRTQSSRDI